VVSAERVALAVDMARVRRIEFDIEKMRPATLVIVTESASDPPEVLVVDPADYGASTPAALDIIGNTDLQSAIATAVLAPMVQSCMLLAGP